MKYSKPIFIVEARRSAIGRFGGGLKSVTPADLATQVAQIMMPEPLRSAVEEVILGQVLQAGAGMNVARQLGLKLGLPQASPAFTANMACASGLKAVALGTDAIQNGEAHLVLAGGVESMSRAPHYALDLRFGRKLGDSALTDAIMADGLSDPVVKIGMGETAERIADQYQITREDQDAFALQSQKRATQSADALQREIIGVKGADGPITKDEHPRGDTTLEKLAALKPAFRKDGTVTAGNASGINDGAALVLLADEPAIQKLGLQPRARIVASCAVGCDPTVMGMGPVGAVRRLLEETGWQMKDVEAIEINEAFAAQALACARELGVDESRLNQRGGAIALGHPIGASGSRVLVTLLHLMEDLKLQRGVASLCVGGGMGIAMAIELVG
jgi:acetyl-CoA C-acetyltransferase